VPEAGLKKVSQAVRNRLPNTKGGDIPDLIQAGDKLSIKFFGVPKQDLPDATAVVEPSSTVALGPPFVRVKVGGLTIEEAEKVIAAEFSELYGKVINAQITMDFNARKTRALLIQRADTEIDYAKRAVEVARTKYDKLNESAKAAVGSVSSIEVDEARLAVERAMFEVKRATIDRALIEASSSHPHLSSAQGKDMGGNLEYLQLEVERAKNEVADQKIKVEALQKMAQNGSPEEKLKAKSAQIEYDKAILRLKDKTTELARQRDAMSKQVQESFENNENR
jgi:hypothetical protein